MALKDTLTAKLGDRMRASMGPGHARNPTRRRLFPRGPPARRRRSTRDSRHTGPRRDPHRPDHGRPGPAPEVIPRRGDRPHGRQPANPRHAPADPGPVGRGSRPLGDRRRREAIPGRTPRRLGRGPVRDIDTPLTRSDILVDQLVENCLREDLPPLEQAGAFKALMDANTWSARRLAEELHVSHQTSSGAWPAQAAGRRPGSRRARRVIAQGRRRDRDPGTARGPADDRRPGRFGGTEPRPGR